MAESAAIILAGGNSTRIEGDKGLVELNGKTLVNHVLDGLDDLVAEILVIVASDTQKKKYEEHISSKYKIITDLYEEKAPLMGALTGFLNTEADYALVTGCDYPFIIPKVIEMLFQKGYNRGGCTIMWPNGWIEPLNAVYKVAPSIELGKKLYREGDYRLRYILKGLKDTCFLPVKHVRRVDPNLVTFFDVDNKEELLQAKKIIGEDSAV